MEHVKRVYSRSFPVSVPGSLGVATVSSQGDDWEVLLTWEGCSHVRRGEHLEEVLRDAVAHFTEWCAQRTALEKIDRLVIPSDDDARFSGGAAPLPEPPPGEEANYEPTEEDMTYINTILAAVDGG